MKTIRGKILLCMTLTVLVSLLTVGIIGVALNYISAISILRQTMTQTAKVAAERIEQELTAYTNVACDAGCTARLANPTVFPEDKKAIIDQLADIHHFEYGNIISSDGQSIFTGIDYTDRDYFKRSMQGEVLVSEPIIARTTGEVSIIVSAPLWEGGVPNTKAVGVIFFVPNRTFLNDIVSTVQVSPNGAAYIINQQGYTIADNTMDTILTQNIEEEARTDTSLSQLAEIHAKMRGGENGFGNYRINGASKFSAYAPIEGTDGWSIGVTAPIDDFLQTAKAGMWTTGICTTISLLVAVLIAYLLSVRIGNPIKSCSERLYALSKGDLKAPTPMVHSRDETSILSNATGKLVSEFTTMIKDMDYLLGEMASGNLRASTKAEDAYIGEFSGLLASARKLGARLNQTLGPISQAADQVETGSEQVAAGAQALSQGATEQASTVEELAATINNISAHVETSANHAETANQQARSAAADLERGRTEMSRLSDAMEEINQSSGQIGQIVKAIEDIAFQTNILALNASVEAARVGAAGKGFAVVADEVRNLAGKSAEASKGITALIETALQSVKNGMSISEETALAIEQGVESSLKTAELTGEISKAVHEQANSIAQVSLGVDQISAVVQTNSATAEQSAAASDELSGQAKMLKNLVNEFQLVKG